MTNFFNATTYTPYAFNDAATYIRNHCISFAGCKPYDMNTQFVYEILRDSFSDCDDAVTAFNYNCICEADGIQIPCLAEVSTDAKVRFVPRH